MAICAIFQQFIAKSWLNDLKGIDRGQRSLCMTHPLMLVIICVKYRNNPSRMVQVTERIQNVWQMDCCLWSETNIQIRWWVQTGFTVQKCSIRVEIGDMSSRVTLKFDGWPWKTIGHLFYAWCSISYPLVNSNWSYSPETPNLGQIRWFLEPCNLKIWQMTLQNNRAPLLSYFKLYASFRTHLF